MKPHRIYGLFFFRIAKQLSLWVPRPILYRIAELIGRIIYATRRELRAIMHENLAQISGLKGQPLEQLCIANALNFARMLADYFYSICCKSEAVRTLLDEWRGLETLKAALARGKGVILVTAHLGHWELGGILLALEGIPMSIITAREPSQELNEWRERHRENLGIKTITLGSDAFAFVEVINALKRNEIVAMLVDRPIGNSAVPVQFGGKTTHFSNAPALLFKHTGAPIIPAFVLQKDRGKYVSFIDPEVVMESANGKEATDPSADPKTFPRRSTREIVAINTQRIADVFEKLIRKHSDQWHNYVRIWTDET